MRQVLQKNSFGSIKPILALFAAALLLLAGTVFYAFNDAGARVTVLKLRLGLMRNADYSGLIAMLSQEKRYDEAIRVAGFVAANPEMPGQERIQAQKSEIESTARDDRSILERGMGVIGGFLSGGGSSTEEQFGGLISNLLLGAGVPEDSLPRRGGEEDGALAKALGGARLGIDGVWFPAVMGTLKSSGRMTPEFERFLTENAQTSSEENAPTPELADAVRNTRRLVTAFGASGAVAVFGSVRDGRDLAALTEWGQLASDETYVVASQGGLPVLMKLPPAPEGTDILKTIARKGAPAIKSAAFWLK